MFTDDDDVVLNNGLFVCVEVLRPSQPNVERGQFT